MNARHVEQFPDGSDRWVVIGEASNGESEERIKVAYHYSNGSLSRASEMTKEELLFAVKVAIENGMFNNP